tara:strand:+ start:789 stop:1118 length:330 start_codon:yes stop_codon:yes gene_type:complete
MSLTKEFNIFVKKWSENMAKIAPVGKRPRSNSAKQAYPQPLNKSIKPLEGPEPGVEMNLYGAFVNSGTRYQKEQPFIDPAFNKTSKDMEEEFTDEVFALVTKEMDKMFR